MWPSDPQPLCAPGFVWAMTPIRLPTPRHDPPRTVPLLTKTPLAWPEAAPDARPSLGSGVWEGLPPPLPSKYAFAGGPHVIM